MNKHLRITLPVIAVLVAAGWIGWRVARPIEVKVGSVIQSPSTKSESPPTTSAGGAWKPPEGDPVQRYQSSKSKEDRLEIIGQFMSLGHERNPFMLIEALKDESTEVRVKAVEYAASLEPGPSAVVLKEACLNDAKDVREMGWSLLAPHPLENKAPVLMAAIERGSDTVLAEAFSEMGRTPEQPLFEAMLTAANRVQDARQARVFSELQAWLKPGGGSVPVFTNVNEMSTWWAANKQRYDQFMLRVDQ